MHQLIFWIHRHLLKTRSRISVRTHTPISSAAMAVLTLSGNAFLLIVTQWSLSAPLITFGTAIPEALHRLPCLCIATCQQYLFSVPLLPSWPMISFLIVFQENVFDVVVNLLDRICDLPFPLWVQRFFEFGQFFFCTSLVNSHFTSMWDHTFNTVRWHRAVCDACMRFGLPKRYAFLVGLPKIDPVNSVVKRASNLGFVRSPFFLVRFQLPRGLGGVKNTVCQVFRDLPALLRWVLHSTWTSNWVNFLVGIQTPSNWEVRERGPASLVQSVLLLCVLEWLECTIFCCKISDNTGILSCCFLSRWSWSNLCQWTCSFHQFGIWIWASDLWISNELPMSTNCLPQLKLTHHHAPVSWCPTSRRLAIGLSHWMMLAAGYRRLPLAAVNQRHRRG